MRILVVEDDHLLNHTLCYNLNAARYTVDSALTKQEAKDFLTKQDYDLIVLDVNLPDGNGFDFCREAKERCPDTAVIFLTANDMESDMLKGYELGAEDYVTKPFPMSVFQKKLAVVLGRLKKQSGGDCYEDGALTINFSEMTAALSGKPLVFTPLEYRLLKVLTKNPQIVLFPMPFAPCWTICCPGPNSHGRPQRKKACFIKSTSVLADCMRSCRKIKTVSQKSRAICRN